MLTALSQMKIDHREGKCLDGQCPLCEITRLRSEREEAKRYSTTDAVLDKCAIIDTLTAERDAAIKAIRKRIAEARIKRRKAIASTLGSFIDGEIGALNFALEQFGEETADKNAEESGKAT